MRSYWILLKTDLIFRKSQSKDLMERFIVFVFAGIMAVNMMEGKSLFVMKVINSHLKQ